MCWVFTVVDANGASERSWRRGFGLPRSFGGSVCAGRGGRGGRSGAERAEREGLGAGWGGAQPAYAPAEPPSTSARAATKAATQRLTSSAECAAESCTRMRAFPRGTTGNENAIT